MHVSNMFKLCFAHFNRSRLGLKLCKDLGKGGIHRNPGARCIVLRFVSHMTGTSTKIGLNIEGYDNGDNAHGEISKAGKMEGKMGKG